MLSFLQNWFFKKKKKEVIETYFSHRASLEFPFGSSSFAASRAVTDQPWGYAASGARSLVSAIPEALNKILHQEATVHAWAQAGKEKKDMQNHGI